MTQEVQDEELTRCIPRMGGVTVVGDMELARMREDAERLNWLLPIFEANANEGNRRFKLLNAVFLAEGLTGRALIDRARAMPVV